MVEVLYEMFCAGMEKVQENCWKCITFLVELLTLVTCHHLVFCVGCKLQSTYNWRRWLVAFKNLGCIYAFDHLGILNILFHRELKSVFHIDWRGLCQLLCGIKWHPILLPLSDWKIVNEDIEHHKTFARLNNASNFDWKLQRSEMESKLLFVHTNIGRSYSTLVVVKKYNFVPSIQMRYQLESPTHFRLHKKTWRHSQVDVGSKV